MSVGKYSPTVVAAYRNDQDWHDACSSDYLYDREGYDSYGYDHKGRDRAGRLEEDYMADHDLFDQVLAQWGVSDAGLPCKVAQ